MVSSDRLTLEPPGSPSLSSGSSMAVDLVEAALAVAATKEVMLAADSSAAAAADAAAVLAVEFGGQI